MIDIEYEELLASRLVYPHSRQPEFRNGDGVVITQGTLIWRACRILGHDKYVIAVVGIRR